MFLEGHSFAEIDEIGLQDVGDVLGYWSGMAKAKEKAESRAKKNSSSTSRKGKGRRR